MPSYLVRSRTTGPILETVVEASSRDAAIAQVVHGEAGPVGATGTTGATGASGAAMAATGPTGPGPEVEVLGADEITAGPTGTAGQRQLAGNPHAGAAATKKSRAELNEMTKEELLEEAEEEGVTVHANWNKADIIDAIVKHK
jgi:hypothetical protein